MAEKKKKSGQPGKKDGSEGRSKAGGRRKHPEQKQAEQEEELTMQRSESEDPRAPEGLAREGSTRGAGEAKEPTAGGPSRKAMEEGRLPVVGIGASAGGLEALEAFFSEVPVESGLAFVVITHTDPKHESMLPDLIRKKSKIPVKIIEDGMEPQPDTVYLPRSNRDPFLKQGLFHLRERPLKSEMHMPVDLFLRSLAEEMGDVAAGVILSGTGTDGTQGLRLIKEKAGLAVAQEPESARHVGMPQSAIETGLVDYVLSPLEMPKRLIQYFKHPVAIRYRPANREGKAKKEPDPLHRLLAFLANRTRHDFSLYKEDTLIRRIERRMAVTSLRNASDYLKLLNREPEEVRSLFQDLLIGVTNFFRDPDSFAFLKQQVLDNLISREGECLRVWIPGCATGEEAFSVAIILQELLEEKEISRDIQIFGTDIDPRAIEKARHASYVQNIVSDVSPERLKRFFVKEDSQYRVKTEIREMVVFAEQNILADPPFSKLDLLVCRNLLIYLKQEAQNRLIPLFHYSLRDMGILFLGSAEGVGRFQDLFESVGKHHSIYRKKNHVLRPMVEFPTVTRIEARGRKQEEVDENQQSKQSLGLTAEKILMEEYTPACVIVNRMGKILHVHGRTGKYLEPAQGEPTLVISDMAREGLRFPILSALRRADKGQKEIRDRNVRIKINHRYQRIDLVVKSFSNPPLEDCRMVIFQDMPEVPEAEQQAEERRDEEKEAKERAELEQELMRVRQDYRSAMEELQTSNEELRSSNEELHSSNEELQSTNEELESSREELQSVNEELNTVNSELNNKIGELKESYNAINAVLDNTHMAIVFVDNDLRVRRFTPEATQLLNLIDSDVGRPLEHITHNLEYEDLVQSARLVLKELTKHDKEVRTTDGHCYRMSVMVHRPEESIIEGVVLTFINIDVQKEAQETLKKLSEETVCATKRFADNIVDTIRESFLVLDGKLRVITANRSFYRSFRTSVEETLGREIFELGNRQWDIPELRRLLEEVMEKGKFFQDYLVEHRFPEIGFRRMMLNARMLQREHEEDVRILLAMEDVTGKTEDR